MPTNQTHTLTTIGDLLRVVTADNLESLVNDMRGLLANAVMTKVFLTSAGKDPEVDIFKDVVVNWTDDNINQQTIKAVLPEDRSLEFVTKATGKSDPN